MRNRRIMKIGWIGVRGYGRRFWDAVKRVPGYKITACLHLDSEVSRDAARVMGCKPFFNQDDFFRLGGFDGVVLTVPNEFHFHYGMKALNAGKHVLVEKPLANTLVQAEKMVKSARSKSLVLLTGHNYRKSGFIVKMKAEIDKGSIGKVVAAEFNMSHGGGMKFGPDKWRFHKDKCPGGPLNMLGTHLIDTANYFFGKVDRAQGVVKKLYASTTAQDMALIQLEYRSGVVANITTLYNSVSTEFINIYGTDGALRFNRWPKVALWFQPKDAGCECARYRRLAFSDNNTAREIFEDYLRLFRGEKGISSNAEDALAVVEVMEKVLKGQRER